MGVLARVAYAFGDCAFPVAALSAAADAMSLADEVAADERRAAPAVHCSSKTLSGVSRSSVSYRICAFL